MVSVEGLREYLRECAEADEQLEVFLKAAQLFVANAGVPEQGGQLYTLLIYMLASHWYDNRGIARPVTMNDIPFAATALIHQLRNVEVG